jgi:Rod binding domain-containing protein
MSTASISPLLGVADPTTIQRSMQSGTQRASVANAAQQFEAILVRQLLGDAMKPMLGTALGGAQAPGSDVYQYLVTDVVAQSVAQGGGLGIAKMLMPQLTPKGETTDKTETTS